MTTLPSSSPILLPTPLGGTLVNRVQRPGHDFDPAELQGLPRLELSDRSSADLEMLATGAYSPLTGFLGEADYLSVIEHLRLADGTPWSIPITLPVNREEAGQYTGRVVLTRGGEPVGTLDVQERYDARKSLEAREVYRTEDAAHPGVAALYAQGDVNLAGPVTLFEVPRGTFPRHHRTPAEVREVIEARGWRTTVAFQTRNPIHRAHEYLHKVTLELVDGLLLHPLVGQTKGDDVPAATRVKAYEVLLDRYYPQARTLLSVYPAAMRYAGPREAILHALSRRNYGVTHFIVGRDHAGVGNYYGTYDAQEIFGNFTEEELGLKILKFEHTFYCQTCGQLVSPRTCPHGSEHHLVLSGTKVREKLRAGERLPTEFTRPEVAEVLREAYAAQG
ncbi:sulfate adenylyltransferase [Deinococcus metallilatus]|uniref:Sulfate adenylyltransferase n=1 Tax=Deinococcus metallilatus TaxID=1211322 RepID=A0AAJ5F375_9DEIO|nr:sulfate adenylyltransferase [Deinococcus metallilatus]MBB5296542.1 sulfate adenylyltransferase [Deinococcus metallilatus]QBY08430.1 sulfate adenylyltransferase [Deinococcus metallilatus]RXJ11229.1 sulfate adenylyltransferase [Deinococcus metallilatus]TLK24720.1 sulfate adenylyltransferase [Deinococcus metallilatus]GMA17460.1 sulfate adenylyltransferase [Deinococcus metallilatus]